MKKIICAFATLTFVITLLGCNKNNEKVINECKIVVELSENIIKGSVNYGYDITSKEGRVLFNIYPNCFVGYENAFNINNIYVDNEKSDWRYVAALVQSETPESQVLISYS